MVSSSRFPRQTERRHSRPAMGRRWTRVLREARRICPQGRAVAHADRNGACSFAFTGGDRPRPFDVANTTCPGVC